MTSEEQQLYTKDQFRYAGQEGDAVIEYTIDNENKLVDAVFITYMPNTISPLNRPGVAKVPQNFLDQLRGIPLEIQGIPITVLIKIANYLHKVKEKEST